ncbi:hypothetical protein PLESTB_000348000 [Pleodorina starrii]|uniref:Uncharacterized protein n=1 Tax=Pleodorina starrii TaxID=330485 RepID=A0A9W6BEQ1_9CHLO|nr:hypothetical protein PLESTM_000046800 [Pleodorina starrii]GLC50151.1 hypothetical protein PLESTB_000348000 [Pleodorina starrii]GLC73068.1 hypothetical protein PLESTF_001328400 [Pleodorina starrii]
MELQPAVAELDQAEDVGFYFKYLGGIAFAKLSAALEAPGATEMVTANSKHGVVFFSDLSGVYALQTSDLPAKLSTAVVATGYAPPSSADVCMWHVPLKGITQLALSADQEVLAAVDGAAGTVSFFPLAEMRLSSTSAPHWTLQLDGIKQFAWCKAAVQRPGRTSGPGLFLVVTADRALRIGRYGDEGSLVVVALSDVESADWCPAAEDSDEGSSAFAYSTGRQLVIAAVGGSCLAVGALATFPLEHPQESSVVFESVRWVLPDSILLGGTPVEDGSEGGDEYSCLMALSGWTPNTRVPPQAATLYTDLPAFIEDDCTPRLSGPYLHAVAVPRWGAVVRCHRKAVDDHVRLMRTPGGEFGSGGSPQAVAVTEEPLMIRLPNGPDGGSNYVLGLALDTSMPLSPLPHPLSAEKPALAPPPVLLILTSDGALRVYGFGHLDLPAPLRPGADAVMPLPTQLSMWTVARSGDGDGSGVVVSSLGLSSLAFSSMTEAASKAALPSIDDAELEEGDGAAVAAMKPWGSEAMSATASAELVSMAASGEGSRVPGGASAAGPPGAGEAQGGATAAEDLASRVALPDEDDDLLDDDEDDDDVERERRRAAAAAGLASDSESGEEVTSPGVVSRPQPRPGATSGPGGEPSQPSSISFPASGGAFGGGGLFGAAAATKQGQPAPSGPFSGFGSSPLGFGAPASNASSATSLFGAPAAPAVPAGGLCFGSGFAAALPAAGTGTTPPAAPSSPWGAAVITGQPASTSSAGTGPAATSAGSGSTDAAQKSSFGFGFGLPATGASTGSAPAAPPPAAPAGGLFGTTGAGAGTGGGLFGAAPAAASTGASLFGGATAAANSGGSGLMGAAASDACPFQSAVPQAFRAIAAAPAALPAASSAAAAPVVAAGGQTGAAGGGAFWGGAAAAAAGGTLKMEPSPTASGNSGASAAGPGALAGGKKAAPVVTAPLVELEPAVAELEQAEDVGFYFKYLGGIAFAKLSAALEAPGATEMVTASSKHGVVFFSDLSGVYALQTSDLPAKLSTAVVATGYAPPSSADVCMWHVPLKGITQLALSADQEVLAAVDGAAGTVSFFPLAEMRLSSTSAPHWTLQLDGIKQFAWCKAAVQRPGRTSGPGLFLVVTADRALRIGRYGDEGSLVVVALSEVESADWCPAAEDSDEGSSAFAYSTGRQLVIAAVGPGTAVAVQGLASIPLEQPQESSVVFESVRWVLPDSILLGGTPVEDGSEGGDEYSCLMALSGWTPNTRVPPQAATLYTDLPAFIEDDCTPRLSGPYLHAVAVPRWGAVVRCHRKAVDDHVRLMRTPGGEFGSGGSPQAVAVTEEPLMIRLPNGPDGGSNYVLGLAFDTSVPLSPLPHPLSAEKPALAPPPVLLILTSDGALRVYGFGHLDLAAPLRPGADAVMPLPANLPGWAADSGAGRGATGTSAAEAREDEEAEQRRAAAAAAVESDSESGEEVTSPGIIGSLAAQAASKPPALPVVQGGAQPRASAGVTFPAGGAPKDAAAAAAGGGGGFGAFGAGTLAPASGTAAAAASKDGSTGFSFGFGVTPTGPSATSAPAAPTGGLFGFSSSGSSSGGGLFGAAPAVTSGTGGLFGSPAPQAAAAKDSAATASAAGKPFSAAAASAASLFGAATAGATATQPPAFGSPAASSPAFGFGTMNLGAVPTPQLGGSSALFGGGGGGGLFAPPARALTPPVATAEFTPSSTFTGPKPGFVFTTRDGVTGYYKDTPPAGPPPTAAPAAPAAGVKERSVKPAAPAAPSAAARKEPVAVAPAAKVPAVDILRPGAKAPVAAAPPPRPASPDVPAPEAKLADESKEAASAEASFLRELHEVRRMAAKLGTVMQDIAAGCPDACRATSGGGSSSGGAGYKAVGASVEALARRAAALRVQYERANKRAAGLFDGLGSLQSMLDALQLFSGGAGAGAGPSGGGGGGFGADSALAALEANLPLEPALDGLRRDVASRLEALSTCLGELEDVLDTWEAPQAGGQAASARLSTSVLYNTLASSGLALSAAASRILVLAARLEEQGACPPGLVKDPSGPLAGLVSWCTAGGASSAADGAAMVSRSLSSAGVSTPSAAARTPDQKAAGGSAAGDTQWHTPRSSDGRRSPLLAAGTTPPSPQQQYASPPKMGAVDTFLPRLQALARIGGRVRVTSAVRPPAPPEPPGAALLQLMSSAEAARGALPEGPEPSSPPRAQIRPTPAFSADAAPAAAAAAPKAAAPAQPPAGFDFGTLAAAAPRNTLPTPSLTSKVAAAPVAAKPPAAAPAPAAAAPPAAKPKAAQPPIPTMAQLQAATKLQAQAQQASKAAAGSAAAPAAAAAAAAAAAPKPAAAAPAKPSGGGQPPVPPMALFAQAAQFQQKALAQQQQVAPVARPTDSGSSAGSTATSKPPAAKPQTAAAPPVPSPEAMRAAAAAQARLQQQQQQRQAPAPAFGAAGTGAQQPPASAAAPASGAFGFGFNPPAAGASSSSGGGAAPSSIAPAFGAFSATGAPAAAAAASKPSTGDSGAAATGAGGASFGFGALSFGTTAPSTAAADAGSSAAASSSPFGFAPPAAFGAATGASLFGASSSAAASAASAAAPTSVPATAPATSQVPAAAFPAAGVFSTPSATGPAAATATTGAANTASLFGGLNFGGASSPASAAGSAGGAANAGPFGSFGQPATTAGTSGMPLASAPAAGTSLFGSFASSAAASSAALGTSGFGVFSAPSTPAAAPAATQPAAAAPAAAALSPFGGGAAAAPAPAAGLFGTQGGIQSKAAMPTVQAGVFSAFGQAPAFGAPAAAAPVAPAFGSPATLGGGAASAFGAPSPAAPAAPALGGGAFGSSGFGAPSAFGSPAPVPPAAPAAPFGGAFGQSSGFGAAPAGTNAFSGFAMQAAGGAAPAAASGGGGFGAFASAAPTPPAAAGGGFAAFAGQGGGFGGFGAAGQQQPPQPAQGSAFGSAGGTGFGAFGGLGGGMSAPAVGSSAASDLWKPRK